MEKEFRLRDIAREMATESWSEKQIEDHLRRACAGKKIEHRRQHAGRNAPYLVTKQAVRKYKRDHWPHHEVAS